MSTVIQFRPGPDARPVPAWSAEDRVTAAYDVMVVAFKENERAQKHLLHTSDQLIRAVADYDAACAAVGGNGA